MILILKIKIITKMSSSILNSAWKYKIEIINVFDEKFLNDKDIALQPISFISDNNNDNINGENNNIKDNANSINSNMEKKPSKNLSVKYKKDDKSSKSKSKSKKKDIKRKSLNNSDLYSSNIVIIQSRTDDDSNGSSLDPIEKEVEKIKKMMTRSRSKKFRKKKSRPKSYKTSNSANINENKINI
jgi:hypothetical protein